MISTSGCRAQAVLFASDHCLVTLAFQPLTTGRLAVSFCVDTLGPLGEIAPPTTTRTCIPVTATVPSEHARPSTPASPVQHLKLPGGTYTTPTATSSGARNGGPTPTSGPTDGMGSATSSGTSAGTHTTSTAAPTQSSNGGTTKTDRPTGGGSRGSGQTSPATGTAEQGTSSTTTSPDGATPVATVFVCAAAEGFCTHTDDVLRSPYETTCTARATNLYGHGWELSIAFNGHVLTDVTSSQFFVRPNHVAWLDTQAEYLYPSTYTCQLSVGQRFVAVQTFHVTH